MNHHGFPLSPYLSSGSKAKPLRAIDTFSIAAGFPSVIDGIVDIPLFVTVNSPSTTVRDRVLSTACENARLARLVDVINSNDRRRAQTKRCHLSRLRMGSITAPDV
jgi:hypothetical protein